MNSSRRFAGIPRTEEEEIAFALAAGGAPLPAALAGRAPLAGLAHGSLGGASFTGRPPFAVLGGLSAAAPHGAPHTASQLAAAPAALSPLGAPLGTPLGAPFSAQLNSHHQQHHHGSAAALAQASAPLRAAVPTAAPSPGQQLSRAQFNALVEAATHQHQHRTPAQEPPSPTLSGIGLEQIKALAAAGRHELLPYLAPRPPGAAQLSAAAAAVQASSIAPVPSATPAGNQNAALVAAKAAAAAAAAAAASSPSASTTPGQANQSQSSGQNAGETTATTQLRIPPPSVPMPSMTNVQLSDIPTPYIHPNDVLCGRGGGTNNHSGNERFRELVNQQKVLYLHSSKRDKPLVSRGIVRAVRIQNPPGRFLQKDEKTGLWYDIGDQKAREKTSQALREGAPEIRKEITSNLAAGAAGAAAQKVAATVTQASNAPIIPTPTNFPNPNNTATAASAVSHQQPGTNASTLAAASYFQQQSGLSPYESLGHIRMAAARQATLEGHKNQVAASVQPTSQMQTPDMEAINAQARKNALDKLHQRARAAGNAPGAAGLGNIAGLTSAARHQFFSMGTRSVPSTKGRMQGGQITGPEGISVAQEVMNQMGRGGALPIPPKSKRQRQKGSTGGTSGSSGQTKVSKKSVHPLKAKQLISSGRVSQQSMPRRPKKKDTSLNQAPSHDTTRRLILAETVAQKTVNGTITEELKNEEYRVSLYLDAGLLGIKREEMAEMINEGHGESEIIQHYYDKSLPKNGNGKRPALDSVLPPIKKVQTDKAVALMGLGALTEERIQKALHAIGAL